MTPEMEQRLAMLEKLEQAVVNCVDAMPIEDMASIIVTDMYEAISDYTDNEIQDFIGEWT
jgi:hypothetical protein